MLLSKKEPIRANRMINPCHSPCQKPTSSMEANCSGGTRSAHPTRSSNENIEINFIIYPIPTPLLAEVLANHDLTALSADNVLIMAFAAVVVHIVDV